MRPTRADHAMGGKNVFISHFPISLSLSFSFSFHPSHPSMNSPAFESSSRPRAMSFAEGRGFKSGNILSLSLPLSNIRYESGTMGEGANASAQVSCPNTLRPDRRLVGTHSERAS